MKKRKIAVLIGLFACALLALGLAGCEHEHTYGAGWTYDATHHWHEATCEHTGEKDGYAEHTWDSGEVTTPATCTEAGEKTYTCTVCSATKTEVIAATGHSYAKDWSSDNTHHWHAATCGHDVKEDYAEHVFEKGVCTTCGCTQSVTEGLAYTLINNDTEYEVSGIGTATDIEVFIPSAHNGLPVTSIGEDAFYGCEWIKSVFIPDSITSIGNYAFGYCYELTSVTIGNGVKSIGDYAFEYCYSLTSIIIPDSVTSIGNYAFRDCYELTSVTIGNGVKSIGDYAFEDCGLTSITVAEGNSVYHSEGNCLIETASKTLIAGCKTSVIPADGSVTGIGEGAFIYCDGLTSVIIPDSITSIGSYAFSNCNNLTSVTIGSSVQSIGSSAFSYCYKLVEVYNKSTLLITVGSEDHGYVAHYAMNVYMQEDGSQLTDTSDGYRFYYDGSKGYLVGYHGTETALTLPASFKAYDGTSVKEYEIAERAFYNCTALKSVTIPESVTVIGDNAFYSCENLTSVIIPDSVTSIGSYAFYSCGNLTSVTIGRGVTSIGDNAFYDCYKLVEVYNKSELSITAGDPAHGEVALYARNVYTQEGGSQLTDTSDGYRFYFDGIKGYLVGYHGTETALTLPASFTTGGGALIEEYEIAERAFYNCTALKSVTIPESVTGICDYAFTYCEGLTSIIIPNSVTSIGEGAFGYCTGLTSVTIGSGVQSIGVEAFAYCYGLTSVTIGSGVTSIGDYAFSGCINLASIVIPNGVTGIGGFAFANCNSLTSVTIGSGVTSIGGFAFAYCNSLTSIIIPDSVTSIGEGAFAYCNSLTSVTIGSGVTSTGDFAFSGCINLASIVIPNGVTSIGEGAFAYCDGLTSIVIPDSMTSIGDMAFAECNTLEAVYYRGTATQWQAVTIGSDSFVSTTTVYYYSESQPTDTGNYWHFDTDGVTPVKWGTADEQA